MFTTGAALSKLSGPVVKVALSPARSVTDTSPVTPAPSALITSGLVVLVEAMPDSASLRVNGTLTLVLFQPLTFGRGVAAPNVRTGGVASRLMVTEFDTVPLAEVTLQVKATPAVSAVTLLTPQPVLLRIFPVVIQLT